MSRLLGELMSTHLEAQCIENQTEKTTDHTRIEHPTTNLKEQDVLGKIEIVQAQMTWTDR